MFFSEYPYTNYNDLNLDYILKKTKECVNTVENMEEWKEKHEKEYIVLNDKVNQLLNNLVDNIVPWDSSKYYPIYSIVTYLDDNYIALQNVPVGTMITNADYWELANTTVAQINAISSTLGSVIDGVAKIYPSVADMVTEEIRTIGYCICEHYYNEGASILYKIEDTDSGYGIALTNGYYANPIIDKYDIRVSQFGAYGDGVHDDTAALQDALDFGANDCRIVFDMQRHLISDTLVSMGNKVQIVGRENPEYTSEIIVPGTETFSPALDIQGQVNSITGIMIRRDNADTSQRGYTAVRVKYPDPENFATWFNMDTYFNKVYFSGWGVGADCYGRNIIFDNDCHFSSCDVGVFYHSDNEGERDRQRGWIVRNCRFHTLGRAITTESDPENPSYVAVKTDLDAATYSVLIENNIFDATCHCFIYRGVSDGLVIRNNYVDNGSYVVAGYIERPSSNINDFPIVEGNIILQSPTTDYGIYNEAFVTVKNCRVELRNNQFRGLLTNIVQYVNSTVASNPTSIIGNTFYIGRSNGVLFNRENSSSAFAVALLANFFGVTGGASGISLTGGGVTINNSSTYSNCNYLQTGIS